jgi:biotin carboxylase
MKSILILGGGVMQMPAIRIARRKGWRVSVADGNPEAPGRAECDHFAAVDLKDRDGITELGRRLIADGGLDGVFTAGTDFSTSVAWVCEKLGLPGIPYRTAVAATDKLVMREAFRAAGVPCPRFAGWKGEGDPAAAARAAGLAFPLVAKPVDNMGARGVRRVESPGELGPACASARAASRAGAVIIEEFMEGPELSLDAIVYRGAATVCGVADRDIRFPPFFVEMGHTMPSGLDAGTIEAACEVFRAGIAALGISLGAAKGDIKVTPRGPMIGEIAARLSGGYMSGWTFPFSSGVEVTEAALNLAVGLPPGDVCPRWNRVSAERAFISIPGTVARIFGVEEARALPGVREVFLRVSRGSRAVFPTNNVEKCGNLITCAATREEAEGQARAALAAIRIRLEPLSAETDVFLFPRTLPAGQPPAYTLRDPLNLRELEGLDSHRCSEGAHGPVLPIPVLPLPRLDAESSGDWHGVSLGDAMASLVKEGLVTLDGGERAAPVVLGSLFWKALLRGGRQGGAYLAESAAEAARRGSVGAYLGGLCGG